METANLLLRPLLASDAQDLFALYGDPEAVRYMPMEAYASPSDAESELTRMIGSPGACYWAICDKGQDQAIGFAGFLGAPANGISGAGYGLRRNRWRQGIASEALTAITDTGFREFQLRGIELWIDRRNLGSRGVAGHVGYEQRATFFQKYAHEKEAHNTIVYGLYTKDWKSNQAVLRSEMTPEPMNRLEPVLEVPDVAAALTYYQDVLGFQQDYAVGDPVNHCGVSLGDWSFQRTTIQLAEAARGTPIGLSGTIYIHVGDDIGKLHNRLLEAGGNVQNDPVRQPWGRTEFDLLDLNGYRFRFGSVS